MSDVDTLERTADTVPDGFVLDAKGNLIAEKNVKPTDLMIDQAVREIAGYADDLSAQIARFRGHSHDDIETLLSLLSEKYGVTKSRSEKGSITLTSFDGLIKVTQTSADILEFGPELKIAKALLDELIEEWGEGLSLIHI